MSGPNDAVEEIRAQIGAERRRLQSLVDSLTANFDDLTEAADASPPDDEHDPEGHTIAFERSQLSARRSDYLRALDELAVAELRIDHPNSAVCEFCRSPIPLERRIAVPTATRCVACAPMPAGRLRGPGTLPRSRVHP
jgi:DnaK suppressor protein